MNIKEARELRAGDFVEVRKTGEKLKVLSVSRIKAGEKEADMWGYLYVTCEKDGETVEYNHKKLVKLA